MKRWFAVCLWVSALSAADNPEISRIRGEWAEDMRSKKADEIVKLYASDGVFLEPNGTRIAGTAAIRSLMKQVMGTFNSDITLRSVSVELSGKLAYDSGDYRETMTPLAGGKPLEVKGTYLTVLRREPDGSWRIVEQMWAGAP